MMQDRSLQKQFLSELALQLTFVHCSKFLPLKENIDILTEDL